MNFTNHTHLDSFSLPIPRILSYNIRSLSYYATYPHAFSRRASIHNALKSFIQNHEIVCLQETHLAHTESSALSHFKDCDISRNNKNLSQAGTIIIDTPQIVKYFAGSDCPLPEMAQGHVQLRRYTPKGPHPPFQLFNVYFKSGDFSFNKKLIDVMSEAPNDIDTYVCGDFNFIENLTDSSSSSPSLPPAYFLDAWSKFKSTFKVFDPPHDAHTFFHITSDIFSPFSWSSRLDRFLLPLSLYDHPLITPTVSIPHHPTNLNIKNPSPTSFSDHLPVHITYDNGFLCSRETKTIPTWLASSTEFAETLRSLWKGPVKGAYKSLELFKKTLFKAAAITKKMQVTSNSSLSLLSQHSFLLRLINSPSQDLSRIYDHLSRFPHLQGLVSFSNGTWRDNGLLAATRDLLQAPRFSPTPSIHPLKALANGAPSSRSRVGGLRLEANDEEAISDEARSKVASRFWSSIWSARPNPPPLSRLKSFLSGYSKKFNASLCPDLTVEDVLFSIKNTGDSTAGPDGLPFAAWRAAPDLAAPILFNVFRAISSGQPPPAGFNKGILFLLPKKNTGLVSDTRPISVTNTDNRILAAAVARQIMPGLLDLIESCQKGFLSGRQGADHVVDVNEFFYQGVEGDSERFLFLLDTAKAFDSIDHSWITTVLNHVGFPAWFQRFIKGCLTNVSVAPFFGKGTHCWIDIERGVKQGCPLSPLLFVIAYDPLLFFLNSLHGIRNFAFADDLAVATDNILHIYPALNLIDVFSFLSGLGVNKIKSYVLATAPPSRYEFFRSLLAASPWPDLPLKEKGMHLGVVIGREVTLQEIWEVPFSRALARINKVRSYVRSLPLHKRILYVNVFIVSIFSYIGLFFILPTGIWKKIKYEISRLIIPFNGGGFTYFSLICSNMVYNFKPALKDVWAFNISLLASRSPYISSNLNYFDLPRIDVRYTKIIKHHRDAAAVDFWRSRHTKEGTLLPPPNVSSSCIYKILIRDVYLDSMLDHDSDKTFRLVRSSPPSPSLSPLDFFYSISENLVLSAAPSFLCVFHFLLVNNSLPTSRRLRHAQNVSRDNVDRCYFCGSAEDSISHIYATCRVVNLARIKFFSSLSLDHSFFRPPPSFLFPSPAPPFFKRPHLFPSLTNFISSLLSPTSPPPSTSVIGECSLASSLLYNLPLTLVIPTLAFNYAVWCFRSPARAACTEQSEDWCVNQIFNIATTHFNAANNLSTKANKSKVKTSSKDYSSAIAIHDHACANFDSSVVFCYVDGSASPNPGPCGAGACLFFMDPDYVVDAGGNMGFGTNNIGELCALAICLTELTSAFSSKRFTKAFIFCDSNYAILQASSSRKPALNADLVLLVRKLFFKAKSLFDFDLIWVKGHARIGGNIRADQLSKRFANLGSTINFNPALLSSYTVQRSIWKHGFPLNNLDPDVFRITTPPIAPVSSSAIHRFNYFCDSDTVRLSRSEPLDFKHDV